jgi:hypothetical protein
MDRSLLEPEFIFSRPTREKIYGVTCDDSETRVSSRMSAALESLVVYIEWCL